MTRTRKQSRVSRNAKQVQVTQRRLQEGDLRRQPQIQKDARVVHQPSTNSRRNRPKYVPEPRLPVLSLRDSTLLRHLGFVPGRNRALFRTQLRLRGQQGHRLAQKLYMQRAQICAFCHVDLAKITNGHHVHTTRLYRGQRVKGPRYAFSWGS